MGSSSIAAPRPKGDKRAQTRARLLDVALELTREKGVENTTLQDVAERAGMTTGAIYGNFKNRDDLLIALAERQWAPIRPRFEPGSDFAAKMRAVAQAVIDVAPERRLAAVGALTFRAYALRNEELRLRIRDSFASGYDAGAAWFRSIEDEGGLPMDADILVRVINAMTEGLLFQRFLTPELCSDEVIYAAFGALAGGTKEPKC